MSSSLNGAEEDEYLPELYARGGVKHAGLDDDHDGCGMSERGHVCILRVGTSQGNRGFPYHGLDGIDDNGDHFVLVFKSTHAWVTKDGEEKTLQSFWRVTVTGKRLENVLRQISLGRRTTLRPGGSIEGEKPYISGIEMMPFEPTHVDDE